MPNLQNHTTSYELSKELHELCKEKGIVLTESLFWWSDRGDLDVRGRGKPRVRCENCIYEYGDEKIFPAYTSSELSEILNIEMTDANESESYTLRIESAIDFWNVYFGNDNGQMSESFEDTSL